MISEGSRVIVKMGEEEIPTEGKVTATSEIAGPYEKLTIYEVTSDDGVVEWFELSEMIECADLDAHYDELYEASVELDRWMHVLGQPREFADICGKKDQYE